MKLSRAIRDLSCFGVEPPRGLKSTHPVCNSMPPLASRGMCGRVGAGTACCCQNDQHHSRRMRYPPELPGGLCGTSLLCIVVVMRYVAASPTKSQLGILNSIVGTCVGPRGIHALGLPFSLLCVCPGTGLQTSMGRQHSLLPFTGRGSHTEPSLLFDLSTIGEQQFGPPRNHCLKERCHSHGWRLAVPYTNTIHDLLT